MSEDQGINTETQDESDDSSAQDDTSYYRVNRLGREIFAGNKSLLITAIQTRRVRGDDLIFDESSDTWGFARKHVVFLEATGQGLEEVHGNDKVLGSWLDYTEGADKGRRV